MKRDYKSKSKMVCSLCFCGAKAVGVVPDGVSNFRVSNTFYTTALLNWSERVD